MKTPAFNFNSILSGLILILAGFIWNSVVSTKEKVVELSYAAHIAAQDAVSFEQEIKELKEQLRAAQMEIDRLKR